MKKLLILNFLVLLCLSVLSQSEINFAGARVAGMGNAGVSLSDNWAVFNNPAAMTGVENPIAGVFYENRFLLKETGYAALSFVSPLPMGNIGVGISHFGYSLFQSSKISVGYAHKLFKSVSMGVNLDYIALHQSANYGNLNALNFELGLLAKPNENFSIGAHVFNPINLSYFENSDYKMPIVIKLGFSYLFNKYLLFAVETGQAVNGHTPILRTGVEYLINEQFIMRTGVSIKPVEYTFGFGYHSKIILFDIAYAYHEVLGSTPKISLAYEF